MSETFIKIFGVPGTVLGVEDASVSKTGTTPALLGPKFPWGGGQEHRSKQFFPVKVPVENKTWGE